jgi:hypothetical protein
MSGSLMAQTKHKPKFPNPKLRTSIELGIISAEAKVQYNITRQHNISLGFSYGYSISESPDYADRFMDNYKPVTPDDPFLRNIKIWSSFMTNFSYKYYFRKRGNYLPNGGYAGVLARYRGAQIDALSHEGSIMKPTSFYAVQFGTLYYIYKNRLYSDWSVAYGSFVNYNYTKMQLIPMVNIKLGWFIGPNKVREDKTTTP